MVIKINKHFLLGGLFGGIAFFLTWLLLSNFTEYLYAAIGGFLFLITWYIVNSILKKTKK